MMKPVRSNPKGYHIHSPFAFHLVTRVIFPQPDTTDAETERKFLTEDHERAISSLLGRLLRFFNPARIIIFGNGFSSIDIFSESNGTVVEHLVPGIPVHFPMVSGDFMIWNAEQIPVWEIKPEAKNIVWFLTGIQGGEMGDYFKNLKKDGFVRQTYELHSCGIVIFNPEFQKEDFVIKGRNSY